METNGLILEAFVDKHTINLATDRSVVMANDRSRLMNTRPCGQ